MALNHSPSAPPHHRPSGRPALLRPASWVSFRSQRFRRGIPTRGWVLGFLLAVLGAIALLAPWLAPDDPMAPVAPPLTRPGPAHWLGVDHLGRDVLSRLLVGARWTLGAALLASAIAAVPGAILGIASGYFEGPADIIISRSVDVLLAFPRLLLALGILALTGTGLLNVALATGLAGIPLVARVVRGTVLVTRRQTYIEAARALGSHDAGILRRHVWPNIAGTTFVVVTLQMGWSVLDVSALSFLGLGPPLGTPEWGTMLNEARIVLREAPWAALVPGLALALTVLVVNLLGDALRDALNPERF
jgi:glutathione transport system permease protein